MGLTVFSAVILMAVAACSPATVLNVITPSSGYVLEKDISFDEHERLKLDVYRPKKVNPDLPIVFFSHGGGWYFGDKSEYKFIGDTFTSAGYVTVIPNYRLHPNIKFPDPVVDTAKAIAWTVNRYPDNAIVLIGHSAGGYNVLMNGLASEYLAAQDIQNCQQIAAVIGLAAPTGIVPAKKEPTITIFPDRFTKLDAPLNVVREPSPPFLLLHGGKDTTVYPENSVQLAQKIKQRGGNADYLVYPKLNHVDLVRLLSRYFDDGSTLSNDLIDYIKKQSRRKANYCR